MIMFCWSNGFYELSFEQLILRRMNLFGGSTPRALSRLPFAICRWSLQAQQEEVMTMNDLEAVHR
jgi:hypothetical protein